MKTINDIRKACRQELETWYRQHRGYGLCRLWYQPVSAMHPGKIVASEGNPSDGFTEWHLVDKETCYMSPDQEVQRLSALGILDRLPVLGGPR